VAAGSVDQRDERAAIVSALDKVGLRPLADRSTLGLDVPLTKELEGGIDLSEGQWQRLAIARALMRVAPGLVVLDEPTSAIDPQTEHEVRACLRDMAEGRSALIVSHRLALASIASSIIVLKEGRIVEQGHHAELMERRGLYREMFLRQASGYLAAANAPVAHPPLDG
jgi:ATP-binding cassette subfamily B protein